ncbi:single-stranded DNA-binding protein [Candidatus Peregrinibacteria bacterium]|nr:single-stranded DNA-binding protein [Candidatus Peregrinibacteria bacterium]
MNHVTLLGHLAADPEIRQTSTGKKVATFSIATDFRWKTKDGENRKNTNFHRISAWQHLGEICFEYLKKGSAVYASGRLSNREYLGKDGQKRYLTEVVADDISILNWKKSAQGSTMDIEKMQPEESEDEMIAES